MKLGYVCQYYAGEYRGPVTNLMGELSRSIDVVNYSSHARHMQYYGGGVNEHETEISGRLTLRRYPAAFALGGLVFPRNLRGLLAEDKPTVIQCEEYYQPATLAAYRYAKANDVPFIINHRASEPRRRTQRERLFFAAANPVCARLVDGAGAIVCLSEAGRRALLDVYPKAQGKVRVIPNSIDPAMYSGADGPGFRLEHGIPESAPLLMCVARLHPQKRIDLLVRAFSEAKKTVPDAVLCIVGPWFTAEKGKVDSIVSRLHLEDVIYTGEVPSEKVKDAYAAADAVALSSEYEPFGYCLLEAMSLKKPVVAFGIGAVPEIIIQGTTGYHVPFPDAKAFGEKASALLSNQALASRLGLNGYSAVKGKFDMKENAGKLLRLYSELGG